MVHTKTYIFTFFYFEYVLVLSTIIVPRSINNPALRWATAHEKKIQQYSGLSRVFALLLACIRFFVLTKIPLESFLVAYHCCLAHPTPLHTPLRAPLDSRAVVAYEELDRSNCLGIVRGSKNTRTIPTLGEQQQELSQKRVPATGKMARLRNFAPCFFRVDKGNIGTVVLHANV